MIIKSYKKYDRRRIFMANKLNQKTSMTEKDIDDIVKKVKNGII